MRKGFRRYSGIFSTLLLVFVLFFCCSSTGYANYVLDPDFGSGGLVRTDIGSYDDRAYSLAIDSQERLVVAGPSDNGTDYDFAFARYTSDGILDSTFGTNGIVTTDFGTGIDRAYSLAIDSQGRLVVAGYSFDGTDENFALARYTSDGILDPSFGTDGKMATDFGSGNDWARSLAIDSDGRLVVAGKSGTYPNGDFALARYTDDGKLDLDFGTDGTGKITTDFGSGSDRAYSLVIDSDGRLVVAGKSDISPNEDFALARYTSDGILDPSFGTGGIITTDFGSGSDAAYSLAIDSQGRLVVAGGSSNGTDEDFALARYTSDGKLDLDFGTGGIITTDFGTGDRAYSLAIDSQGRLVVAGYSHNGTDFDFTLARYTSDGKLDLDFGTDGTGKITTDFGSGSDFGRSLTIDKQGRLVVAGYSNNGTDYDFALARYKEIDKPVKKSSGGGGGCNSGALSSSLVLLLAPLILLAGKR